MSAQYSNPAHQPGPSTAPSSTAASSTTPPSSTTAPSTAPSPAAPHHHHPSPAKHRVLACITCQQRKVRCDRKSPCANCVRSRVQCVPAALAPRPRRRRFPEQELLERLRHYEELLRNNGVGFEPLHGGGDAEVTGVGTGVGVLPVGEGGYESGQERAGGSAGAGARPGGGRSGDGKKVDEKYDYQPKYVLPR